MKAVILAGGFGTRISEETGVKPKPMVEIGGKPILWHIMKIYSAYGINDFVIVLRNSGEPRTVTIGQLVEGEIGENQYVSVSGYALYEEAYIWEIDREARTAYYYLFDSATGHAIVIDANTSSLHSRTSKTDTITGMTDGTFDDLKRLIKKDASIPLLGS